MILDNCAELLDPPLDGNVEKRSVPADALYGLQSCSEFAVQLFRAFVLIRARTVWENVFLYERDPGMVHIVLPINDSAYKRQVVALGFALRCEQRNDDYSYLRKGEIIELRVQEPSGNVYDWVLEGPVRRAPMDLKGPLASIRLGARRATLAS